MLKKWIALLLSAAFMLVACHSAVFNQTDGNIADVKIKSSREIRKSDSLAKPCPPLVIKKGLYVDTTPINLSSRPSWLKNHIVIRGDQLPFSYYSRLIAAGAGEKVLTKYQVGLDPASLVSINYSGTIQGALDMLASRAGFVYSVKNNMVYWQAFITRTYDIAFIPGDSDYLLGKKSGGGGSANTGQQGSQAQVSNYTTSDSSDSEYSSLTGKVSIWRDLQSTITQLLTPEGKLTVSQASTSVTVRDRPTNVQLVGQFIANLNNNLSKQVLVKVQVIEVNLSNAFNYGIDWSIITKAFHNTNFQINANYGTPISLTALGGAGTATTAGGAAVPTFGTIAETVGGVNKIPSYTILVNALNQQGKASVVSEPRVLCLNNQVSVVRIVKSEGYVASIQNTTLNSSSGGSTSVNNTVTSQVTPGMVITGLTLYILPKILHDRVYLSVNADLSTNNGFGVFGPTNSQIQLPNITEKHFNQRSMIKSGDSLILSGFKQMTNRTGATQFITAQALGGTAAEQLNTETIVLITPIILHGSA